MNQTFVGYVALAGSVALHGFAVTQSASEIVRRRPQPPSVFELSFAPPVSPALSPPEPEAPPEREPPKTLRVVKSEPTRTLAPSPELAARTPPEPTGLTLTGDNPTLFEAPVGSGSVRNAAVVAGLAPSVARVPVPATQAPPPPPLPAVPLAELSRKPVPPSLGAALRRNYPRAARSLGKSGDAKVRARIETTGEIRVATISSETSAGFGEACRRTLVGSRWSAPLDKSGRPVATFITYQCKFRIDD